MLYVKFGVSKDTVRDIDVYFEYEYDDSWFSDPEVVSMIKEIDNSDVIGGKAIESPYLGVISPRELSSGVKALILLKFKPEEEYYGTAMGNNCAKWILRFAEKQDITLAFVHVMNFPEPFELTILETGEKITNMNDYVVLADRKIKEINNAWEA